MIPSDPPGPRWVLWGLSGGLWLVPAAHWMQATGRLPAAEALLPLVWLGGSLSLPLAGLAWGRAGRLAFAALGIAGEVAFFLEPAWLRFP